MLVWRRHVAFAVGIHTSCDGAPFALFGLVADSLDPAPAVLDSEVQERHVDSVGTCDP